MSEEQNQAPETPEVLPAPKARKRKAALTKASTGTVAPVKGVPVFDAETDPDQVIGYIPTPCGQQTALRANEAKQKALAQISKIIARQANAAANAAAMGRGSITLGEIIRLPRVACDVLIAARDNGQQPKPSAAEVWAIPDASK